MITQRSKLSALLGLFTFGLVAGGCELLTATPETSEFPGYDSSECNINANYEIDCTWSPDDFTAN